MMALAGMPPVPVTVPAPSNIIPSSRRLTPPPFYGVPADTSIPIELQTKPNGFNYSRADPSIRWPNLKIDEHFFNRRSHFPSPSTRKSEHVSDTKQEDITGSEGSACPESLDNKQSRSRVKKMSKLELKRAKDWRRRAQLLADQILALPPSALVADVLDRRAVQMTPTDFCFVVKLVGATSWTRALEAFEWLNLRRRYSPFPRMLAAIISILGRHGQHSLAEEIFERCVVTGDAAVDPSVQVFNSMMGVYARSGRFDDVRKLFDEMRERGLEPDLVSFNILINARAKSGSVPSGSAKELLQHLRQAGLRPDTITYNTLISACSQGPNFEDAMAIFEDMMKSKCLPDLWTYNAMISVYSRCGMNNKAEQLFHEIISKGFFPDAVTYNSLLFAFAKEGSTEKVESVCEEMIKAGFNKDEITYNTIIHMYGKQGRLDLALRSYDEMKLVGCSPDAVTFTILIDLLGKADRIAEAGKVMKEMVDASVRPTLRTYSALIYGYAKAGMRVEAEKTFDIMVRSGIKPDCLAYSVMLDVLLRACEARKAMVLYRKMRRDGFTPDHGLYQIMLGIFAKIDDNEFVDEVVKDMESVGMSLSLISSLLVKGEWLDKGVEMLKQAVIQGFTPNHECLSLCFNSLASLGRYDDAQNLLNFLKDQAPDSHCVMKEASIILQCKKHEADAALEEYREMKVTRSNFQNKSCRLYEALINCCEETGSYSEASQMFSDMKFLGFELTENIYRSLISVYCKLGFPETAHELLDRAKESGILSNDLSIHVNLIETYGKLKLWQRAESLVGKLRLNSPIDRKVWNALICAYAQSGRYEQARAIFNLMMKNGPEPSVESVNGLMQALICDKRLDELYVVIQELQDMGFKISKSTIVIMLDAFARVGNIFEVKKIYYGMKAAGYLPTMHLYRTMIELFSHAKRVRDVELMVAEMAAEASLKPDIIIFNSLLNMYTRIEDFRKSLEIYHRILEAGLGLNEDTYNTLITMYSRDMKPEQGFTILNEMRKHDLEPKMDTYKSLLASCGKMQLWDQAEELFHYMLSKRYRLDRSFYHIMMKIYRDGGNHSKAENLLSVMTEAGVKPTIATMHMLMVSYGTAGQPQNAEDVLNNIKSSGLELSTLPYSSVIDAYLKNGDYKQGIAKMLEMRRDGIEADQRIWTCFIRAASFCQQTTDTMLLLNTLRDHGFDLPVRLLTENSEALVAEVEKLLGEIEVEEHNTCFNLVNAVEDLLWAFERRATASWIFQMAIKKGIYRRDIFRVADGDWGADFRKLSGGAALVALTLWLDHMQDASLQGYPESPKSVVLITGGAEYNLVSLEKTLRTYLWEMGSPFLPCPTRTGVLIAKAHSLRMWLKDSSFCMDLELKDAPNLPSSNSMALTEGYFMRAGLVPAFNDINERLGKVRAKKFARLALLSEESRDKVIKADIQGRKEKQEKLKKKGTVIARKATRLRTGKFMRRRHNALETQRHNAHATRR